MAYKLVSANNVLKMKFGLMARLNYIVSEEQPAVLWRDKQTDSTDEAALKMKKASRRKPVSMHRQVVAKGEGFEEPFKINLFQLI